MFKRYILASLVAGFTLAAPLATASDLWFYPGHGWLAQPPFSFSTDMRSIPQGTVLAGPTSSIAGSQSSQAANPQAGASPRVTFPAPYDTPGGYLGD